MAENENIPKVSNAPPTTDHDDEYPSLKHLLKRASYLSDAAEVRALIERALACREEVNEAFTDEVRRLQKACALLIATQFAANHDVEFDASDAMAAILTLIEQALDGLNQAEVEL